MNGTQIAASLLADCCGTIPKVKARADELPNDGVGMDDTKILAKAPTAIAKRKDRLSINKTSKLKKQVQFKYEYNQEANIPPTQQSLIIANNWLKAPHHRLPIKLTGDATADTNHPLCRSSKPAAGQQVR